MSKIASNPRGSARCASCVFGRIVSITETNGAGKATNAHDACECHVSRPTRYGFPTVRLDDYCAYHVDAATHERTFAGMLAERSI